MDYRYHYDDMDNENRPPACYQLKYRGVTTGPVIAFT